jgi:chaperone required for assembly of F1-ATPase
LLAGKDPFRLIALHAITTLTGSAILALALAEGRIGAEEAWTAAHVEEDWQIAQWGEDAEAAQRRAAQKIEFLAACRLFDLIGGR